MRNRRPGRGEELPHFTMNDVRRATGLRRHVSEWQAKNATQQLAAESQSRGRAGGLAQFGSRFSRARNAPVAYGNSSITKSLYQAWLGGPP